MQEKIEDITIKRILFPTDFSDLSISASAYAIALARCCGAELLVLHVVDHSGEASGMYVPHMSFEGLDKEGETAEAKSLQKLCARLGRQDVVIEPILCSGSPQEEILKVAGEKAVDIIVIGTSGTGGVGRLVFGSNTDYVIRHAHVPVLAIPPVAS